MTKLVVLTMPTGLQEMEVPSGCSIVGVVPDYDDENGGYVVRVYMVQEVVVEQPAEKAPAKKRAPRKKAAPKNESS